MYCVIQFYVQLRGPLAEHSPFLKVLAIKLVIFLSFWQTAAISVGTSTLNLVKPGDVLAYPDIKVGVPSLLLCFEMSLFAILHLWAFPYRPYLDNAKTAFYPAVGGLPPRENEHLPRQGGWLGLKALWDAVNIWDVVKAFGRGMRWLFVGVKHRHEDVSYQAARKNSALGGGVDMDDLGGLQPGVGKRFAGVDTAYGGMGAAGAKSTDHLPIATEFRRSRFGVGEGHHQERRGGIGGGGRERRERDSDDAPAPEHAGLIAHAQPNPHSPAGRPDEYGDDAVGGYDSRPYHSQQQQPYAAPERQEQQPYPMHDRPSSLSTVEEESYSRAGSVAGGQYGGGRGNPRNSTQMKIGNALWGGGGRGRGPEMR
jgi:hypothetical protein